MCLAIFKPAKCVISEAMLRAGWQRNSDGAGFAFVRNGKVQMQKGYMTVKDFLEAYNAAVKANKKSPFVIHFRIRTQGDRNQDNTHPFPIKDGVLIHNGSLEGTGSEYGKGKSDTCLFAEKFGNRMDFETVNANKVAFNTAVGFNKMVLLYDDGRHIILNEVLGTWQDDVWYSNIYFQSGRPLSDDGDRAQTLGAMLG